MWEAGRTEVGVRGSSSEVTSAISSSSADCTHGGSERAARWRSRLSAAVELVPLEYASVCGVLEMLWLWLFRTVASLWSSRERPETTLTLEWGRCCEDCDEAVGGGMGEGSRRLLGLRNDRDSLGPLLGPVEPWSLFLRSAMGLLAIPRYPVWGVKGRGASSSHERVP